MSEESAKQKGGKVVIRTMSGKLRPVDEATAKRLVKEGEASYASAEEMVGIAERAQLEAEHGGTLDTIQAFGEGAADTFFPGISSMLNLGGGAAERAEANPFARGLGSLFSVGSGVLAAGLPASLAGRTGASALIGKAAQGAGAATGWAGVGAKAGQGILKGANLTAASTIGRGVLAGAVETGIFSAGQTVTDLALTDKPITAETLVSELISNVGRDTLLGGALGGALGTGKVLARAAKRGKLRKVFSSSDNTSVAAREGLEKHIEDLANAPNIGVKTPANSFNAGSRTLAINELNVAQREFRSVLDDALGKSDRLGDPKDFIKVVESGDADSAVKAIQAYSRYQKAAEEVEALTGSLNLDQSTKRVFDDVNNRLDKLTGVKDSLSKAGDLSSILKASGLPVDDAAVTALSPTADVLLKGALVTRALNFAEKGGRGLLGELFTSGVAGYVRGKSIGLARRFGLGEGGQFATASAAGSAARIGAANLVDGNIAALVNKQLRSQGRIGRAVSRFGKTLLKGPVQIATYKAFDGILSENEVNQIKSGKSDAEKFREQMKIVKAIINKPDELSSRLDDILARVAVLDPELGILAKKQAVKQVQFLAEKFPINPGNMASLSGDRWLPSPQDMIKFARYQEAMSDFAGIVEKAMTGRLTPEGAEVLKKMAPAHYAEMQKRIMSDPTILKKMEKNYGMRINLGLLFEIPTDPTLMIMPQLQDNFVILAEQAAQAQQAVPAGPTPEAPGTGMNQPTAAQKLENR